MEPKKIKANMTNEEIIKDLKKFGIELVYGTDPNSPISFNYPNTNMGKLGRLKYVVCSDWLSGISLDEWNKAK